MTDSSLVGAALAVAALGWPNPPAVRRAWRRATATEASDVAAIDVARTAFGWYETRRKHGL
jgi:hypothetical protein